MDGRIWEAHARRQRSERIDDFDLVHNQLDWLPLAFAAHCAAPMVTTIHGFSGAGILPAYKQARSHYVAISDADRSPELDYIATIYHGVDLAQLPFTPQPATTWWCSAGSIRTRAPPTRSRSPSGPAADW